MAFATDEDEDLALARSLQFEFDAEAAAAAFSANEEVASFLPLEFRSPTRPPPPATTLTSTEWETLDPTPDLHALFQQFDAKFFSGRLVTCEVRWSPRMTRCAGMCYYVKREKYCSISDLVETLLHEMIHAFLFVTDNDDNHESHGQAFHQHMYRINKEAGTKITVYHSFHDEVDHYLTHWWKCTGPCQHRKPFFGLVKRSMNRPPGPNDTWFADHQANCGGTYIKIKEPEGYGQKKSSKRKLDLTSNTDKKQNDIRSFFGGNKPVFSSTTSSGTSNATSNGSVGQDSSFGGGGAKQNIFGFGGSSFSGPSGTGGPRMGGGGLLNKGKSGTVLVRPGSKVGDNSSGGSAIPSASSGRSAASSTVTSGALNDASSMTSSDARQATREAWQRRFDGNASSSASAAGTNASSRSFALTAEPSMSSSGYLSTGAISKRSSSTSLASKASGEPATAACPVCSKHVPVASINSHLDECLNHQSGHLGETKADAGVKTTASAKTNGSYNGNSKIATSANAEVVPVDPDLEVKICRKCKREVYAAELAFHTRMCEP